MATTIAAELEKRQNASTRSARNQGPHIVIIADDYGILVSGGTEPLKPLLPYLPSTRGLCDAAIGRESSMRRPPRHERRPIRNWRVRPVPHRASKFDLFVLRGGCRAAW